MAHSDDMARATEIAKRMTREKRIVSRVVRDLITAGYWLQWADMGQRATRDDQVIMRDYAACDEMTLTVHESATRQIGWVQFVYGNDDGTTVIADYNTRLESVLAGANRLADTLAE